MTSCHSYFYQADDILDIDDSELQNKGLDDVNLSDI